MAEAGDWSGRAARRSSGPATERELELELELEAHGQSGLLSQLPAGHTEAAVLTAALCQLTAVTRALTRNVRHMNVGLERALLDKEEIDELEGMLNRFMNGQTTEQTRSLAGGHSKSQPGGDVLL